MHCAPINKQTKKKNERKQKKKLLSKQKVAVCSLTKKTHKTYFLMGSWRLLNHSGSTTKRYGMNWVGMGVVVGYNVKKAIFVENKLLFLECNNFLVEINLKIIRRHDFFSRRTNKNQRIRESRSKFFWKDKKTNENDLSTVKPTAFNGGNPRDSSPCHTMDCWKFFFTSQRMLNARKTWTLFSHSWHGRFLRLFALLNSAWRVQIMA